MCVALDRHDITDQIAAAVHERTGGLPLYVEQVKHLPALLAFGLTRGSQQRREMCQPGSN